jgi:hypothetical protein
MLVCWFSKNLDIIAIATSNYCYVNQAKHNIATATIGEQPTNLFPTSTPLIPPLQPQRSLTTIGLPTTQLLQFKQAIPLATSLTHHGNRSFPLFFHLLVIY